MDAWMERCSETSATQCFCPPRKSAWHLRCSGGCAKRLSVARGGTLNSGAWVFPERRPPARAGYVSSTLPRSYASTPLVGLPRQSGTAHVPHGTGCGGSPFVGLLRHSGSATMLGCLSSSERMRSAASTHGG
eukprot:201137-Chlamydomonas_euryale.AAC.2